MKLKIKNILLFLKMKKYLEILERAHKNPLEFGNQSYDYKLAEMKKDYEKYRIY